MPGRRIAATDVLSRTGGVAYESNIEGREPNKDPKRRARRPQRHEILEAKALLDSRVLKIFQPEVGNNGGILESCKTAALAELYDVEIATHNWCGPILTRAASHVCARTPNLLYQEYAGGAPQNEWENELLDPPTQIEKGRIILSDGPGLGSVLNEDLLASRRID